MSGDSPFGIGSCARCGRLSASGTEVTQSCPDCDKNHSCPVAILTWVGGAAAAALAILHAAGGI